MTFKTALLIGDQHNQAASNLRRYDAIGNFILERKPDYVINFGDVGDFSMLYGINSKKSWALRDETRVEVEAEIGSCITSQKKIFGPYNKYIEKLRKNRKKGVDIKRILLLGNHDVRAFLYHKFNKKQFNQSEDDWFPIKQFYSKWFDYQVPTFIEGIVMSHNFVNGTSTASTVDTITKLAAGSAIGAHSHKMEFSAGYTTTKRPIFGLQPGWFYDPDDPMPDWVGSQGGGSWWNGVTYLHGLDGTGYYDVETVGTARLLKEYL